MHQFASWSYALSLWWLGPRDTHNLHNCIDVDQAMSWMPTQGESFVVAEDGGLYPGAWRLPTQYGLNYNLQDVELNTSFGPSTQTGSTTLSGGKFTIIEPYGVTFIDSLVQWAQATKVQNYVEQPYMLQIDFVGYDDKGNTVPVDQTEIYRKRFPITISNMKVEVTTKGAEYRCELNPLGYTTVTDENAKLPKAVTVVAGTIKEFFTKLEKDINEFYAVQAYTGKVQFPNSIKFDIDVDIANSTIVNPGETGLVKSDPTAEEVDASTSGKVPWSIPYGTDIVDMITKVMSHSSFLIDQLGLENKNTAKDQTTITNMFKTLVGVQYNQFDEYNNSYSKTFRYRIHQMPIWNAVHPSMPQFPDSRPFTVKNYNYLYTGKNVDITDFKINFDQTYHNKVLTYNTEVAATIPSPDAANEAQRNLVQQQTLLTPSALALAIPKLGGILNVTPARYKHIVANQNVTSGMNIINRPAAIVAADAINTTFNNFGSGMLTLKLGIVGDPTLLKQDGWLYIPHPSESSIYNSWDTLSQADFVKKYGQLRLDNGPIACAVTINTPLDIDTDWTNNGLVFPAPNAIPSLFSGQYILNKTVSTFRAGVFTQQLELTRVQNNEIINASMLVTPSSRDSVSINNKNQQTSTATNTTKAAGDGGTLDPAVAYGGSSNAREQTGT